MAEKTADQIRTIALSEAVNLAKANAWTPKETVECAQKFEAFLNGETKSD